MSQATPPPPPGSTPESASPDANPAASAHQVTDTTGTPPTPPPTGQTPDKPRRGLIGLTSLGLFGMNILGLLILWPVVCFTNWYLVGFFEKNLDGELSWLAEATVTTPWWVISIAILMACGALTVLQWAIKSDGKTATINIIVAIVVLVYLVIWLAGIGTGLYDVWTEANAPPDPLPPIPADRPPADVPDPIRPLDRP